MIKGTEARTPDHPIDTLFVDRWSPRAMSGEPIDQELLLTLFEAARWAPSSNNRQPWRMLYARRETPHWELFFDLLSEGNKGWCHAASALVLFISYTLTEKGGPAVTHSFDTGAAWENFALQGTMRGLVVHGMQGFDYARAKTSLGIPDEFRVEAMVAVGRPGRVEDLPERQRPREHPSGRRPLAQTIFEGPYRA